MADITHYRTLNGWTSAQWVALLNQCVLCLPLLVRA